MQAAQTVAWHRPLQQFPLQQPCALVQAAAFGAQRMLHTPLLHVVPVQHSAVVPQVPPWATQH
jgi:hypothetical protein